MGRLAFCFFFFQAEDGIRDATVTGVQTCALPISLHRRPVSGPTRVAVPGEASFSLATRSYCLHSREPVSACEVPLPKQRPRSRARKATTEAARVRRRFERLLSASVALFSQRSLDRVLQQVVDSARAVVGAKYAALGVLAPD